MPQETTNMSQEPQEYSNVTDVHQCHVYAPIAMS